MRTQRAQHLFLSYRRNDMEFTLLLAAALREAGMRVWLDRLDIRPGDDWRNELQESLQRATAIIPVLSRGYTRSRYCQRELSRADRLGHPVFPVLLEPLDEDQWPIELERAHFIDFRDWRRPGRFRQHVAQLASTLRDRFGTTVQYQPDETEVTLTNMAIELQTRCGLVEYLEHVSDDDQLLSPEMIRPEPANTRAWLEHDTCALLERQSTPGATGWRRISGLRSIIELTAEKPRLLLLGEPGSGKTATLKHLALNDIHNRQLEQRGPLPLLLPLADWEDDVPLDKFIAARWSLPGNPARMLTSGAISLYLDGLDELGGRRHQKASTLRKWLASARAPQRVLVTCRSADFRIDLDPSLPLAQIMPLDETGIRHFARSWLGVKLAPVFLDRLSMATPGGSEEAAIPQARLPVSRSGNPMRLMARNAFLLGALCLLHKSRPSAGLDENRGTLLQNLSVELWRRYASSRDSAPEIGYLQLEHGLGAMATAMTIERAGGCISREYALQHLGSRELLETATGIGFLQQKGMYLRFTWEAQREYFAARAWRAGAWRKQIRAPRFGSGGKRIAGRDDTLVITAACLAPDTEAALLAINRVNPFLALDCIAAGIEVSERVVEPIIGNLLQMVWNEGRDTRVATASALAEIDPLLAAPLLLAAMRDGADEVRLAAATALQEMTIDVSRVRTESLSSLRRQGAHGLATILRLLAGEDRDLRRAACHFLADGSERAATPALLPLLRERDELLCIEASEALARLGDALAAPALAANLDDNNWRIRRSAALALAAIGEPALDVVLPQLEHATPRARRLLAAVLARIEAPRAGEELERLAKDSSPEVREVAREALRGRTPTVLGRGDPHPLAGARGTVVPGGGRKSPVQSDTLNNLLDTLRHGQGGAREKAARALGAWAQLSRREPDEGLVARLVQLLRESDWMLRWAGAEALAALGSPSALPSLIVILRDTEQPVRIAAVRALQEIGDARAAPHLLSLTNTPDNLLREAVAEALGSLGHPAAIAALGALSADREPLVRLAAIHALGRVGLVEGEPWLLRALRDVDAGVRWHAVAALERVGTQRAIEPLAALTTERTFPMHETQSLGELAQGVLRRVQSRAARHPRGQVLPSQHA